MDWENSALQILLPFFLILFNFSSNIVVKISINGSTESLRCYDKAGNEEPCTQKGVISKTAPIPGSTGESISSIDLPSKIIDILTSPNSESEITSLVNNITSIIKGSPKQTQIITALQQKLNKLVTPQSQPSPVHDILAQIIRRIIENVGSQTRK